jgi:hypothetical protein
MAFTISLCNHTAARFASGANAVGDTAGTGTDFKIIWNANGIVTFTAA